MMRNEFDDNGFSDDIFNTNRNSDTQPEENGEDLSGQNTAGNAEDYAKQNTAGNAENYGGQNTAGNAENYGGQNTAGNAENYGGQNIAGKYNGQDTTGNTQTGAQSSQSSVYRYTARQIYGNGSTDFNRRDAYRNGAGVYGQSGAYRSNNTYGQGYGGYGQNGYYGQSSPQGNDGYGQNSYDAGKGTYQQGYSYKAASKQRKQKHGGKKKVSGWVKVVCYALIFGVVAGGVFEGIHFAGSALRKDASSTVSTQKILEVVRVSSQDVKMIEAQDVSDIVDEVMPAIVSVNTVVEKTQQDFFGRVYSQEGQGAGSGFIFSQDDEHMYIATNYHVIEDSKSIDVNFNDGTTASAIIKGYDENADIAVLMVPLSDLSEDTKKAVKVAVIGDSDAMKAGNGAIAIGNALGYGQSVTTGAISAVERTVQLTDGEMSLLQTSAAINPGNSGGPLLNAKGEVIGINTVKYSETTVEGMGFAIPINSAMETINDIISGKIVNKSDSDSVYFGIKGGTVTEALAEKIGCPTGGVYVSYVYSGSAAHRAGIQQGYIITEFDGKKISTIEELQEYLKEYKPGDSVTVEVYIPDNNGNYEYKETLSTILGSRAEAPEQ